MTIIQPLPLLPSQDEICDIDCYIEDMEQIISFAKERQQKEEPLFDEIENIHKL